MANRSMAAKIIKAKKEAVKDMTESANNFSCTRAFRDTRQSKYDWFGTKPYSTAK